MTEQAVVVQHDEKQGTQLILKHPQLVGSPENQGTGPTGNCMTQISAGPAALLYSLMDEVLALYTQIQGKSAQLSKLEIGVQSKSACASADFAIKAANAQADTMKWQAVQSIVGGITAGVNLGCQAKMMAGGFSDMKTYEEKAAGQEQLLNLKQKPAAESLAGDLPTNGGALGLNQGKINEITERKTDLQRTLGTTNYEYKGNNYPETAAYAHIGEGKDASAPQNSLDQDAIDTMREPGEYAKFREDVRADMRSNREMVNGLRTDKQMKMQLLTTFADLLKETSNACTTGIGVHNATQRKGADDAAQQVTQFSSQSAGAAAQMTTEQMKQFFSKIAELIAAIKQAAMAYV